MGTHLSICSFRNIGRLGNFLFEAACAYGYSKKHGIDFSVPYKTNDAYWNPLYLGHLVHNKYKQGYEDVLINESWNIENHFNELQYNKEWTGKQIILNGYWQSYKYFDFCREDMLRAFGLPWELNKGVCAIHVRRGDYLLYPTKHPVVNMIYLVKAVDAMKKIGITRFKFFSDDIPWCVTCGINLQFPDCEFEYSTGKSEMEDLVDMSCCEHQIISNSTMSWWAAELNRNPRKVCIIPSEQNWFGPDNHLSVKDLYREEFVQIKY